LLDERLTAIGAFGCVLILAGAVAVEVGPLFGRKTLSGTT
jgi:ABC-type sulfate transport system permease component